MHFLCLHGVGTNSHVMETQFSTVQYEMDRHHTFDFVEGTEVEPAAPEIKAFYPAKDTYFGYFKPTAEGVSRALALLEAYIEAEGPFDGAIGFSQGAALISTYLLKWASEHPGRPLPLQCAIFFSASRPLDIDALRIGELKWAESDPDKAMLLLPTAHIWGAQDDKFQDQCKALSSLCDEARREVYIHGEGHEIPGPRARADVQGALRAIRRAIETASSLEH